MKIRTITLGFNLPYPLKEMELENWASFLHAAKAVFERNGYEVQTLRMTTQPLEEYYRSKSQILEIAEALEIFAKSWEIDYFSMGTVKQPENVGLIYEILKNTRRGFCTTTACTQNQIVPDIALATAKLIKKLAGLEKEGFGNLRFACLFNPKPDTPFYPASYHSGRPSFGIGCENSDIVYAAFSQARDLGTAGRILMQNLEGEFRTIEQICEEISAKTGIKFEGIDVSVAPGVERNQSIAYAFEKLGIGKFGEPGTLAAAKIVTDVLDALKVRKCGYSGLMLPMLEDTGLAKRNAEGRYNLTNLLLYSAVCGTGLDTIPLPGNVSTRKIYHLLLDIGSLAAKLNKFLSARLMPIPGRNVGSKTNFRFEYFANTKIPPLG
ncbi:MAG: DUF711 family protein [Thermoplasmata archaeon]